MFIALKKEVRTYSENKYIIIKNNVSGSFRILSRQVALLLFLLKGVRKYEEIVKEYQLLLGGKKTNINTLIKDISNRTTVFVVTHNNTLGISNKADKLIYTMYNDKEQKYQVYVGNFTDTMLTDKDGKTIQTYDAIVNCMEAGVETYEERRKIYENLKV